MHRTESGPEVRLGPLGLTRLTWAVATGVALLCAEQLLRGTSVVDEALMACLAPLRRQPVDLLMTWATRLGGGETLVVLVLLCVVAAAVRRDSRAVSFVLAVGIGAALLTAGLKCVFIRERPELLARMVAAGGYSFPSGHSFGSAAVYGAAALCLGERYPRQKRRFWTFAAFAVLLVGVSRAYLRVHFPSDVLAGWGLGLLWLHFARSWYYPRPSPQ